MTIKDLGDMEAAARKIVEMGARAVIVKGGHMENAPSMCCSTETNVALAGDRVVKSRCTATGCAFASAIAAQLASGPAAERSGDARESLRDQSDREELSNRQRPLRRSTISTGTKLSRLRAASMKCHSTACTRRPKAAAH